MLASADRFAQERSGSNDDVVNALRWIEGAPLMFFRIRQMLYERTAERDVQHLETAADGEHRNIFIHRLADQSRFPRVAFSIGILSLRLFLFAIQAGIDIGSAGQKQPA